MRYPGGSHLFILNGPPSQRVDWCRRVIEWVEAHSNWDDSLMIVAADHGHYLVIDDPQALAGAR